MSSDEGNNNIDEERIFHFDPITIRFPMESLSVRNRMPRLPHSCIDTCNFINASLPGTVQLGKESGSPTILFHPNCHGLNNGIGKVRGERCLQKIRYFWEFHITCSLQRSISLFGIGTRYGAVDMHTLFENRHFINAFVLHDVHCMRSFRCSNNTIIGMYYDGIKGTLQFYKNGALMCGYYEKIDMVEEALFPVIMSISPQVKITLINARRSFLNLQDRCREVVLSRIYTRTQLLALELPRFMQNYIEEGMQKEQRLAPASTPVSDNINSTVNEVCEPRVQLS